ncbi:MAG TPA: tetratricopeptide repeat protein, partial [Burkholderiales bacterium]|nr:tetratricopeptide repeat protein [Burkholderiales bacterium]
MKALEKAAKDREETDAGRAVAVPSGGRLAPSAALAKSELTLEPIAAQPATLRAAVPREPSLAPRKPAAAAPSAPVAAASGASAQASAQAATLIRAERHEARGGIGAYAREHPLFIFGTLAALFVLAYGTYVYLQIMNPGLFTTPPRAVQSPPNAPIIVAPAPVAPTASGGTITAVQPPVPLTSLLPQMQEGAEKEALAKTATPAAPSVASGTASAPPAPVAAAPAPRVPRDTIKFTTGGATPSVNALHAEAYAALAAGNFESSQRLYSQLLRSEPGNVDAVLGLAAIATQQGDSDASTRHYLKVLELDPRNPLAQAGLIGIVGRADPQSAETRVKQLIARDPSAYLYFTLGNTYIDQNRWPDAQQAFFQAYHMQPDNPDYAYNLAVALEQIGQPKPALDFYRRAAQLASARGRANFSTAAVQDRI